MFNRLNLLFARLNQSRRNTVMSTGEANYTFPLGTNYKTIRHNDNVKIIKHNSDLQSRKMTAESFDSTDQKEGVVPRNKETNQFLYMDVGRWGGR